jgi:LacI family transcriptional regulator
MGVVTMKDIGRDLGISAVTVSKVLRNHPDISEVTRERVLQRVKELKYRPNLMARALVTGRTSLVAFVIPDLADSFFSEIAISLSIELRKQGYSILMAWTEEDAEVQLNEMQHLLSLGMDAMIVATSGDDISCFRMLEEQGVPYLLLDRDVPELKAPFVGGDDVLAGKLATRHLIDSGCKRIAHICGPSMSPGNRRLEGYKLALKSAHMPIKEQYIVTPTEPGPRNFHHGFEATTRLLKVRPRVDGLFCFNDQLAVGAMEAAFAAGLRIPEDLAIIGCGNHPFGAGLRLPLSTIDQDTQKLGERSAKALLSLLKKSDKTQVRRTVLKPRLVVRATSVKVIRGPLSSKSFRTVTHQSGR